MEQEVPVGQPYGQGGAGAPPSRAGAGAPAAAAEAPQQVPTGQSGSRRRRRRPVVRRRQREAVQRPHRLTPRFSDDELGDVLIAAVVAGLTPTGHVAKAAVDLASARLRPVPVAVTDALEELLVPRRQVQRFSVLVNQASPSGTRRASCRPSCYRRRRWSGGSCRGWRTRPRPPAWRRRGSEQSCRRARRPARPRGSGQLLVRASRRDDRACRQPGQRLTVMTPHSRALQDVGRALLIGGRHGGSDAVVLLGQLLLLVDAVRQLREAQGRAVQAQAAARAGRTLQAAAQQQSKPGGRDRPRQPSRIRASRAR